MSESAQHQKLVMEIIEYSIERDSCSSKEHFFRVIMEGVEESSGLNKIDDVLDYLSQNVPVPSEITNNSMRKALILENRRIPGLLELIKEYKQMADSSSGGHREDDAEDDENSQTGDGGSLHEDPTFVPVSPERFIPSKYKTERLSFTQQEATDFLFSTEEYDIKLQEIIRELATIKVANDPVACACLYRCLLEMCARRIFAKKVSPDVRVYNEGNLCENLNYINNNVIFNGLTGSEWDKKKKAIKDKFGKDGLIDVLNMFIHYPQMVDVTYIVDSWNIMKIFVNRCLCI